MTASTKDGGNCSSAGPTFPSLWQELYWRSTGMPCLFPRAAAGPEAGSTPGPVPPLGAHSPRQPFLHPASLPAAPHVGGRGWCGFAVRPVAGWVSLIPCFSSRKLMVTAHRPCSAYSAGPGPRVLNEVFDSLSAFLLELIPQLVQNPGRDLWSRSLGKCLWACISLTSHNCPDSCIVPLQMRKGGPREHKSL